MLKAPDAQKAGLKIWFDKDDLRSGGQWQLQIESAIQTEATAFVVYVGSRGVMNWVNAEARIALSRAITDKAFLFLPVLAAESAGASALPPFANLYQGVRDPLGDIDEFAKLLKAILQSDWDKSAKLTDEPFIGLRSMREEEADRFFGREEEVKELVTKFGKHRIVAIVADSGTGKSSLAEAGFIPAFRGGELADRSRDDPDDRVWHVVTMRPGTDPKEGLRTGITTAAQSLGQSPDSRASLRRRVDIADASETTFALQCDLPPSETSTLLIVDQFEELFTATPGPLVAPFVKLLLALADGDKDVRLLLTVRADYFNLLSGVRDAAGETVRDKGGRTLFDRLTADGSNAVLRLKRISETGLRDAVVKPLQMAGDNDVVAQDALLRAVRRDISDQPSDLPLLQVALRATWRERGWAGLGLLAAYHSVDGVLGALAKEAEKVRMKLPLESQLLLESIFVRLVRLGDTGGATRRLAALDEFDDARKVLIRQLGDDEHGRLVVVGEASAEIAHEALITQWPWLQGRLKADAPDVRRLDRLMSKSREWGEAASDMKNEFLAFGAEREVFAELAREQPGWLSQLEREFIEASNKSYEAERNRRAKELRTTRRNESTTLAWQAFDLATKNPVNAAKVALAAWPRNSDDTATPKLSLTLDALEQILPNLRQRMLISGARVFAAYNPSGTRIVTGCEDNTARLWDATSGREIVPLVGHLEGINSGAFSPDGTRVVTGSNDYTARLWDADSGKVMAILRGHAGLVVSVAFSPDGTQVITASLDNTVKLWDSGTGRLHATLAGDSMGPNSASFSPDGTLVVTAFGRTARVWDVSSAREVVALVGHTGRVTSAAFSPDGTRVVTASYDGTARLWLVPSGREEVTLSGHTGLVVSAVFSPGLTHVITASLDRTARLWNVGSARALSTLVGHTGEIVSASFNPDGTRVVTASNDKTARLWDVASGHAVATFTGHVGRVFSAVFSPDETQIVTVSDDKTARLWDAASGRAVGTLSGHKGRVNSAAVSPLGTGIVTSSDDHKARLWDGLSGSVVADLTGHNGKVQCASFSPDGKHVVTASDDKTVRLWDAASCRIIRTLAVHAGAVNSATFSPDGTRVVTASDDKTASLWDVWSGRVAATFFGHNGAVKSAAFNPDGTRIITASGDNTVRLWDVASERVIVALCEHSGPVNSAVFSPDGMLIVTASDDNTARLWDTASYRTVATLTGHKDFVFSAAFNSDGTRVVTASSDGTARLWDTLSGRAIATLVGHAAEVASAVFSANGRSVVTASWDYTARIWDIGTIPNGHILQVTCRLLNGNFSLEGVTRDLILDRPICATSPPSPNYTES